MKERDFTDHEKSILRKKFHTKHKTASSKRKAAGTDIPPSIITITEEEFFEICKARECFYCEKKLSVKKKEDMTMERKHPNRPYEKGNVVLACSKCNQRRGGFTIKEMKEAIAAIELDDKNKNYDPTAK